MFRTFLIFFCAFFSFLSAEEKTFLDPSVGKITLGKSVYYFEDKTDQVSFEEINSQDFQKNFIRNDSEIINFGYNPNTFWFRFDIQNLDRQTKDWLFEIGYANLDKIEFYFLEKDIWDKTENGDTFPFSNRNIFSRFFVFPLELTPERSYTFYLKVKTSTVVILPLTVYRTNIFIESTAKQETWYTLFYGAMAIMIIYNGFIYLSFRSNSYLLYCFATSFMLLFYVAFNGHGFQYLWQNAIWWQNNCVPIFTALAWFFLLSFTNRFLELRKNFIILSRICLFLQVVFFITFILLFISIQYSLIIQNLTGFVGATFVLTAGTISLKKGNRAARFFVIAWFTFLLGVILFTLTIFSVLPANFFTVHTIQIGSFLELILLSFALSDRYQIIQSQSIKVQRELLDSERRINETLEDKVKERTIELKESLRIIKNDLAMAKKIQSATLASNLNQNEKLEIVVRYHAMSEVGGDFYSVDKIDDSTLRIFLADATGHGVQAALIMMAIQGIYDSIKNFVLPVNEIMEIFSKEYVRRYGTLNSFLTCILIDINTDSETLVYSSAGHPAALLINKKNEIQLLKNTGGLIGVHFTNKYNLIEFPFKKKERLFIFTDGIFEQFFGDEEFGEDRLYRNLLHNNTKDISDSLDIVLSELESFLGDTGKQDDITLIGIGYKENST
ncbi:MAG: SpoIIE family protein phosphatase [Leptospiraceae bacterium]|nr:SpoIIE family protein phosphatase [Leptospiraceae bacterium]